MHAIFMMYGIKDAVDFFMREMQTQKHKLVMTSPEGKTETIIMQGQLRLLPFGVYEYIFPKEDMDKVLTTLEFASGGHGAMTFNQKLMVKMMRKMLNAEAIPEFKKDIKLPWIRENVSIIPIGIRMDGVLTYPDGEKKGWFHEAI